MAIGGDGSSSAAAGSPADSGEAVFWYVIAFVDVPCLRAKLLVAQVGLLLPAAAAFYGCWEDHSELRQNGCVAVHSCVVVLLGLAQPMAEGDLTKFVLSQCESLSACLPGFDERRMREWQAEEEQLFWSSLPARLRVVAGPSHLCVDPGAELGFGFAFSTVADWVKHHIVFIDEAGKGEACDLRRCVFGFSGILSWLRKQFGAASESLVDEMDLAKRWSDQQDGIVCDSTVPMAVSDDEVHGVIFVGDSSG